MRLPCPENRAFTLLEVLIALAVFSTAATVFVAAVNSGMIALDLAKNQARSEVNERFILRQILPIPTRRQMEEGGEVVLPDDTTARWSADILETNIVDLFELRITLEYETDFRVSLDDADEATFSYYVLRQNWYENPGDRTARITEKRDTLENRR